jgi:type I restriction-modification system DNA methylase subunit
MKIDVAAVRKCLKSFDFSTLFREHLGWDKHQAQLDVPVDGSTIRLTAVAQKRGFAAYVCQSIPDRPTRLKIDHQVTKSAREHFVIYADQNSGQQVWQWVRREPGKPLASRDHRFHVSGAGDALIQRLEHIAITLDEEESLTVVDVAGRARAAFDVDKVTKKFYDRFKAEHAAFLKFIKGIKAQADLEWYTSLMLNRLMFVYFIQKKGFLDGDTNYLRNRMRMVRELKGKDKFQSFYRYFLLCLFHEGLAKHKDDRKLDRDLEKLLGKVPYLNGGFFEVHQLEERNTEIDIPDKAFEKLFDFFDEFSWHLDERPLRAGNEINPDVVGYIFEKYINQKQMGAYYTKEDITEYISKNTIIPFLFDAAQKKCPIAFKPESFLWRLLRDDPDRYIYAAVRHGVIDGQGQVIPLPQEIEAGIKDVSKRDGWNRPATDPYALPTETWREHVARRQRCLELRDKLSRGEVHAINDLITLNLDIWQFARDAIVNCEGPELLRAFWQAIAGRMPEKSNEKFEPGITVLDPTCGSGAFLFAALRILETLYSDCLERMERFVEDQAGSKSRSEKFSDFKHTLAQIAKHPSERYFILKSIIIGNLFGVDIMEEAVEICKLRLFLKLVAQVERVEQIEPLPDIDFNIRAGNTLVGYVSLAEIKKSQAGTLGFGASEIKRIEEDALAVEKCFEQFRAQQTTHGGKVTAKDKAELRKRLAKLDAELDRYLAGEYGIDAKGKNAEGFDTWKTSHQPFHWFVEFYGIMANNGFDVIIGNPPYIELKEIAQYKIRGYACESAGNLYALVMEQCFRVCSPEGRLGFIVPVSSVSTERYQSLQNIIARRGLHYSSFDDRPSRLFDGLQHIRLTVHILGNPSSNSMLSSTRYNKWAAVERPHLFTTIRYALARPVFVDGSLPKLSSEIEHGIVEKLAAESHRLSSFFSRDGTHRIFYSRKVGYFLQVLDFQPRVVDGQGRLRPPSEFKELRFSNAAQAKLALCCLNSTLFYWFVTVFSDCRHVNKREVDAFPIDLDRLAEGPQRGELTKLAVRLMKDLDAKSDERRMAFKHDSLTVQCIIPKKCKPIIDEIDSALAKHYGFTNEELDFIVNYDIKYRMGQESSVEED